MASTLPRFVVFYSNSGGKYVTYVSDEGGELDQILAVKGGHVSSPQSRFEVEKSTFHPTMVHIRSSHNNKYLRRRSKDEWWIVAGADKPVDDVSQWSTTLFLPEFAADGSVRLLHTPVGRYAQVYHNSDSTTDPYEMCIRAGSPDGTGSDPSTVFQVVDWEKLVVLPKHVAFRGNNWRYLGLTDQSPAGAAVLQFKIDDVQGDRSIANEIVTLANGTVRVKNVYRDAFWRRNGAKESYIWADDDSAGHPDSVFKVIKVDEDTIALRNMGNNRLCKIYTGTVSDGLNSMVFELTDDDDDETSLVLKELVASRTIADFKFHLGHGRVYDVTPNKVVLNRGEELINETEEAQTLKVELHYTDIWSCSWIASNRSLRLGLAVQIHPDEIPCVSSTSGIQTTAPFQPSYFWGQNTTKEFEEAKVHEVTLPPMTTVTVKLLALQASCDVPFTYTRRDGLAEAAGGGEEVHVMEDGVYTGTNYFDLTVEPSLPEPIAKKN